MDLCFIGKYPPIEGGVSTTNYWLARGLAERGHHIHVVTNAPEVEPIYQLKLIDADWPSYQPTSSKNGGQVYVHSTQPFNAETLSHIPMSNPFVTKLAGIASTIIESYDLKQIFAYYFEPYGVAAFLASRWTNRPLVIKHAGSDLDRLMISPDLSASYLRLLQQSHVIVTQPSLMRRFISMGIQGERLVSSIPFSVPTQVFHPDAEVLDIAKFAVHPTLNGSLDTEPPIFDQRIPTVGIYGKIGPTKGTFDLIVALGQLAREGVAFNFVAMIGADQAARLSNALREAAITDRFFALPFMPHWRVPSFIRACTAVCFLERDFPVAIHGPIVPREVLSCGTCLVISGEIVAKQRFRAQIESGRNIVQVNDPKDHRELASALRRVVTNPEWAKTVGMEGHTLSGSIEDFPGFVSQWETLFENSARKNVIKADRAVSSHRISFQEHAISAFFDANLSSFLSSQWPSNFRSLLTQSYKKPSMKAWLAACDLMIEELAKQGADITAARSREMVRHQRARLLAQMEPSSLQCAPFAVLDCLHRRSMSRKEVSHLSPVRSNYLRIEHFSFNVCSALSVLTQQNDETIGSMAEFLAACEPQPIAVAFQRSPNFSLRELVINGLTEKLLLCCDGHHDTEQVVESLANSLDLPRLASMDGLWSKILGALQRLYQLNIIVFGEHREGWGWTGGGRSELPSALLTSDDRSSSGNLTEEFR